MIDEITDDAVVLEDGRKLLFNDLGQILTELSMFGDLGRVLQAVPGVPQTHQDGISEHIVSTFREAGRILDVLSRIQATTPTIPTLSKKR